MDRTFQDLTGIDKPFGGKVVIMGGDFRQVLPVIPRAGRTQVVEASLNRSFLWSRHVCVLTLLHQNMRVQRMIQEGDHTSAAGQGQQEFSNWLKRIGEGMEKIIHSMDLMQFIFHLTCALGAGTKTPFPY